MALTAEDIAALDPTDPAEAAVLQEEALYWLEQHDTAAVVSEELATKELRARIVVANIANVQRADKARQQRMLGRR